MKAIVLERPGSTENFVYKEVPQPVIALNEVLIKVEYISINPVDIKTRKGGGVYEYVNLDPAKELILGLDIAGTVMESHSGLFKHGDDVFGMVNFIGIGAAYAEMVAAPASHLALKPDNITFPEAAAATLAALTAWQNVVNIAKVKAGDRVLIHAAAGGVGHYAVQIAKHFGAYVIGTSSAENKNFVLSLGADEHIDYKSQVLADTVKDVDFVLECLDNESIIKSLDVIKSGGRLISLLSAISPEAKNLADARSISIENTEVSSNGADMNSIAKLLQSGAIRSHISRTFAFNDMALAHDQIESGRTVGKVVVKV
jgi:NADPH:quinone reductase-like Zn-dependent oxidoreductase